MATQKSPGPIDWMKAVARSELKKREKAALNAMIPYIEWGEQEASCYPSMKILVQASGYSERALQDAMRELEAQGIVRVSEGPPGWKTYTRTLVFSALKARTTAVAAGGEQSLPRKDSGGGDAATRKSCGTPPQPLTRPSAAAALHPRSHSAQSFHRPSIEPVNEHEDIAQATDGLDEQLPEATRKRQAYQSMKEKGVKFKNLERLAESPQITPELVGKEWTRIRGGCGIRDATAVLVSVLADHAGIELASQSRLSYPSDSKFIGHIEKLRRNTQQKQAESELHDLH